MLSAAKEGKEAVFVSFPPHKHLLFIYIYIYITNATDIRHVFKNFFFTLFIYLHFIRLGAF